MVMVRRHVIISGRVQGVWFRGSAQDKAESLGITGWVRNTRDGRVESVFEGDEASVNEMISWCHHGPTMASVTNVEIDEEEYRNEFKSFDITY